MSTLETNSIGKYSGDNVSVDDSLNLKSYDTTARDALTSVAGDAIYNSTTSKVEYYTGSAWVQAGDPKVEISYLIIAGGGSGGSAGANTSGGGGGGAGGYINSYASETSGGNSSTATKLYVAKSTNYAVSIGAGGTGGTTNTSLGITGNDSYFSSVRAYGGGGAGTVANVKAKKGGSGGGDGAYTNVGNTVVGTGLDFQGFRGGLTTTLSSPYPASGGGGAGAAGTDASYPNATAVGGVGLASSITGSSVTRGGGGGGSIYTNGTGAAGGTGGGGTGGRGNLAPTAGTVNTGGGGGGSTNANASGAGGSGVIILRYPNTFTLSQSGMTLSTATDGSDKVTTITAGTGTVSFA